MQTYQLHTVDGEVVPCESCASEVPTREFQVIQRSKPHGTFKLRGTTNTRLCEICASTAAGTACEYPDTLVDVHHLEVLKMIAFVGNLILRELREMNERGMDV